MVTPLLLCLSVCPVFGVGCQQKILNISGKSKISQQSNVHLKFYKIQKSHNSKPRLLHQIVLNKMKTQIDKNKTLKSENFIQI